MTIRAQDLSLSKPCPVDLDDHFARSPAKREYCSHCSHNVHMLSAMTEREAEQFLADSENQDICISYKLNRDGDVVFRPQPIVPIARLRRAPGRFKRFAAAGVTAALAACTPHGAPNELGGQPEVELQAQSPGPIIPATQQQIVVGEVESVEGVEPVKEIEETPCEPEVKTPTRRSYRGRKRRITHPKKQPKPARPDKEEVAVYGFL
ncbi:MAG: hypothetical protein ACPG4T_16550 [Nannocystaceae bacterium]